MTTFRTDGDFANETFQFFTRQYDVTEAKRLLAAKKRRPKAITVDVTEAIDILCAEEGISMGVHVDWKRVRTDEAINLDDPIILVNHGGGSCFPIDGWHRIAKARLEGRTHLPGYLLSVANSKKVIL